MVGLARYRRDTLVSYSTYERSMAALVSDLKRRGWVVVSHINGRVRLINGTVYRLMIEEVAA